MSQHFINYVMKAETMISAHCFRVKGLNGLRYCNKFCAFCHNVINYRKVQHETNFCREYKIWDLRKNLLTGNNKAAIEQKNCKVGIEMSKTSDYNLKFLIMSFMRKKQNCIAYLQKNLVETAEDFENLPNPFLENVWILQKIAKFVTVLCLDSRLLPM